MRDRAMHWFFPVTEYLVILTEIHPFSSNNLHWLKSEIGSTQSESNPAANISLTYESIAAYTLSTESSILSKKGLSYDDRST
jgi:hypothetical protein